MGWLTALSVGVNVLGGIMGGNAEADAARAANKAREKQAKEIQRVMETCVELEVPSKADIDLGESWGG